MGRKTNMDILPTYAYLSAGFLFPIHAPAHYRWGRSCQTCETRLTPRTANPRNYRQCRLCRVLTLVGYGPSFRWLWRNRHKWADGLL